MLLSDSTGDRASCLRNEVFEKRLPKNNTPDVGPTRPAAAGTWCPHPGCIVAAESSRAAMGFRTGATCTKPKKALRTLP